jgi:serine protein kinase
VDAAKHGNAEQPEVITLNEYIDRVAERPTIAATAHQRIYDMIRAGGYTDGLHAGEVSYRFFRDELFGLDVPL